MTETNCSSQFPAAGENYWLTRFVMLRLPGGVYAVAFLAAAKQILSLSGSHGLLPVGSFLGRVQNAPGSPTTRACLVF